MANDRLYLVCRHCDARKCLTKYYPSCWHSGDERARENGAAVILFVEEHIGCSPRAHHGDLDRDTIVTVETEQTMMDRFGRLDPPIKNSE